MEEIRSKVDVPLVLHGGSGLTDDDFKNSIAKGIAKMNIFTDLFLAGDRAMKESAEKGLGYLETRSLKVQYIKEEVKKGNCSVRLREQSVKRIVKRRAVTTCQVGG